MWVSAFIIGLLTVIFSLCPGKDIASRAGFYIATTIMSIYNILPLEGKSAPDPYTVKYNTDFLRYVPKSPSSSAY